VARSVGNHLPDALQRLFDGTQPEEQVGFTILLVTVTNHGWPHLAMLSVGELVAVDPREIRLALWPASSAAANLGQGGKLTLACVHNAAAYSIRCRAVRTASEFETLAVFKARVDEVFEDVAPYAVLEYGVGYHLTDVAQTLERWKRVIAHLKTALL
jgi:hypothetical protein